MDKIGDGLGRQPWGLWKSCKITKTLNRGDHTGFVIQNDFSLKKYTVERRYREFLELWSSMETSIPKGVSLPVLPKRTLNKMAPEVVSVRAVVLEKALNDILRSRNKLRDHPLFINFLGIAEGWGLQEPPKKNKENKGKSLIRTGSLRMSKAAAKMFRLEQKALADGNAPGFNSCFISKTSTFTDPKTRKKHTLYHVKTKAFGRTIRIARRFSDFRKLWKSLEHHLEDILDLPRGPVMFKLNPTVIERRKNGLNRALRHMITLRLLTSEPKFLQFLGIMPPKSNIDEGKLAAPSGSISPKSDVSGADFRQFKARPVVAPVKNLPDLVHLTLDQDGLRVFADADEKGSVLCKIEIGDFVGCSDEEGVLRVVEQKGGNKICEWIFNIEASTKDRIEEASKKKKMKKKTINESAPSKEISLLHLGMIRAAAAYVSDMEADDDIFAGPTEKKHEFEV